MVNMNKYDSYSIDSFSDWNELRESLKKDFGAEFAVQDCPISYPCVAVVFTQEKHVGFMYQKENLLTCKP